MRPVLLGDVRAVACALLRHPPAARDAALARLFEQAQAADLYRRRFDRPHPAWGDGSLAAAARAGAAAADEPFPDDPDYLDALLRVLRRLAARRAIAAPALPL